MTDKPESYTTIPDGLRRVWVVLSVLALIIGVIKPDAGFIAAGGFLLGLLL